ncbi:hypothetical protein [Variovorax sp. Sphag1AA]|uniref:hypothetical protein n=1 Tax=Variovorax sp. Sphag1AA TaxID=2587027 RepID=UPI001622814D|nr:hypothetical protein [Variovorax sp. Sphag1AA]MBB3181669.1 hypothetical protein [Variovorax sp. Sphag1AA]
MIPTIVGLARRARSTFQAPKLGRRAFSSLLISAFVCMGTSSAFAAGGSLDATARVLGKKLGEILGDPSCSGRHAS